MSPRRLAGLAAIALIGGLSMTSSPTAAQDPFFEISPLNQIRLRRARLAQEGIRFWEGASADRPGPTVVVPETYPSNPFAEFRESERATIERRAKVIVDWIASRPSFKGPDVRITVEPELERTRGKWSMIPGASIAFTVETGGSVAKFQVQLGHDPAEIRTNELDAGPTVGGCPRAMIEKGEARGQEFLAQRVDLASAVGGIRITPPEDVLANNPSAAMSATSAEGRVLSALHSLNCLELINMANAVGADDDERLAPEF